MRILPPSRILGQEGMHHLLGLSANCLSGIGARLAIKCLTLHELVHSPLGSTVGVWPHIYINLAHEHLGTSAAFTGNTPSAASPQNATVRIDNGTSFVVNYQDPQPQTYMQWFITPLLNESEHTITVSDIYGTAIDYAIVGIGNRTSLTGQTIVVDDDSSLIRYTGQWTRNINKFTPGGLPKGNPYGNVTHRSSNPGDAFEFQFSGKQPISCLKNTILTLALFQEHLLQYMAYLLGTI
jgi:hypothetical protein